MLPKSALSALDAATPQINPLIANGLATTQMKETERFIDSVFRIVARNFPPELKYLGWERCTPLEEYAEQSRPKQSKTTFDVARSDLYMVKYLFQFGDDPELIRRFLYLPFVGQAGTIYISGSRFVISPVLADQVISIGLNSVFVRLLKAKLTFNRVPHTFKIDGSVHTLRVAWAKIYNKKPSKTAPKATTTAKSTLVHYLLAKHGLRDMFALYADCHPLVGGEEITREKYPVSDWVICESVGAAPRKMSYYMPTTLRIAVPRVEWTRSVERLIAGVFYVIDHFPDKIQAKDVDDVSNWQNLLGQIIWSANVGIGKLISDVKDHILSLDEYLDEIGAKKLRDIGYASRDIYHLMFHIIDNFDVWDRTADDRVSTMYDKELNTLQFVCYDIISGINQLYFNLISAKKKDYANSTSTAKSFNRNKVDRLMGMNIRTGLIYELNKDHGEISTTGTSGDNMALKVTSLLVPQWKSTKATGKSRSSLDDPAKRLHVSVAEVGGCWALPKAEPDGRSRINPTLQINPYGLVLRDMRYVAQLDAIQQWLRRK